MTDQYDDIDKLSFQLEQVQKMHADSLRLLQDTEGKLLDKTAYNQKRKVITEAHEQASKRIIEQIEETKAETRKRLALDLRYSGATAQEQADWAEAIRLVEGATAIPQQEELMHRALCWGDKALARALVYKFGGQPAYKAMHEVLSQVDERVKATFDYEVKHGAYKKKDASSQTWAGWQTYKTNELPDIPGRAPEKQPNYLREQKRKQWEQLHAGNR